MLCREKLIKVSATSADFPGIEQSMQLPGRLPPCDNQLASAIEVIEKFSVLLLGNVRLLCSVYIIFNAFRRREDILRQGFAQWPFKFQAPKR